LLGPQTAFTGGLGGQRGTSRTFNPESVVEAFGETIERQLAVANLRALIAHYDPHRVPEVVHETGALAGTKGTRTRNVEDQLNPRVGGIGVLPARAPARAETPLQLSGRDDQVTAADPEAVCRERQPRSGSWRGQRSHERKASVNGRPTETTPELSSDNPSDYSAYDRPDEGDRDYGAKETSSRHCSRHGPGGTARLLGPLFEIIVHGPPPGCLRSA
jgi:hypothetical protein